MIRLAAGMGWFWFVRGLGTEGISWLERARSPRSAVAAPIRAAALNWASVLTLPRKDHAASTELAALSVRLLRESGDESASLAMALVGQGRSTGYSGDRSAGMALLEEALAVARALDHPLFIGAALDSLAEFAFLEGDLERATTLVTEALDRAAPPSTPVGDILLATPCSARSRWRDPICMPPAPTTASRWRSPGRSATPHFSAPDGSHRHDRRRAWARRSAQRDCWARPKRCPRSPEPGPSSPPAVRIARRSNGPRGARRGVVRRGVGTAAGGCRGSRQRPRRCRRPNRYAWYEAEPRFR